MTEGTQTELWYHLPILTHQDFFFYLSPTNRHLPGILLLQVLLVNDWLWALYMNFAINEVTKVVDPQSDIGFSPGLVQRLSPSWDPAEDSSHILMRPQKQHLSYSSLFIYTHLWIIRNYTLFNSTHFPWFLRNGDNNQETYTWRRVEASLQANNSPQ